MTSKDDNLTKSHALYLESRLVQLVQDARRVEVDNGTRPFKALPESDTSDMEYFLAQVRLALPALGFNFLQPKPSTIATDASNLERSPEFELSVKNVHATAREIDGQFVVLKGSTAAKDETQSIGRTYKLRRERLISNGIMKDAGTAYRFEEEETFDSPSGAACVVAGATVNGREFWKVKGTGETYNEWASNKLPPSDAGTQESTEGVTQETAEGESQELGATGTPAPGANGAPAPGADGALGLAENGNLGAIGTT